MAATTYRKPEEAFKYLSGQIISKIYTQLDRSLKPLLSLVKVQQHEVYLLLQTLA